MYSYILGRIQGGGGSWGLGPPVRTPPPSWGSGPQNFIKRWGGMFWQLTITQNPPPPFRNPVSAPELLMFKNYNSLQNKLIMGHFSDYSQLDSDPMSVK